MPANEAVAEDGVGSGQGTVAEDEKDAVPEKSRPKLSVESEAGGTPKDTSGVPNGNANNNWAQDEKEAQDGDDSVSGAKSKPRGLAVGPMECPAKRGREDEEASVTRKLLK